jgi:hypothetical protein
MQGFASERISTMTDYSEKQRRVNVGREGETPKIIFDRKGMSKRVNLGEEGSTPKKFIVGNNDGDRKRVNIGIEGMTPKKVVNADGTTKTYNFLKKRVNVGDEGHTPIKTFEFFQNIPIAAAPNKATFSATVPALSKISRLGSIAEGRPLPPPPPDSGRSQGSVSSTENPGYVKVYPEVGADLPSPSSRPKTSRGKSHPSPDEFFDYVVPSPPPVKHISPDRFGVSAKDRVQEAIIRRYSSDENDGRSSHRQQPTQQEAEVLEMDRSWQNVNEDGESDEYDEREDGEYGNEDGDTNEEDNNEPGDMGDAVVEGEEEIYDVSGADSDGPPEETWEAQQQRHIRMSGPDEQRNKQVRMLGCWLFGSALRI